MAIRIPSRRSTKAVEITRIITRKLVMLITPTPRWEIQRVDPVLNGASDE